MQQPLEDTWEWWNKLRTLCNCSRKLGIGKGNNSFVILQAKCKPLETINHSDEESLGSRSVTRIDQ